MRITIVINNHNEITLTIKTIPNMAVKREREKKKMQRGNWSQVDQIRVKWS